MFIKIKVFLTYLLILNGIFFLAGCTNATVDETPPTTEEEPIPQATSLLGEKLYEKVDTTGAIASADSALALMPDDVDRIIAAARVRRNFWQYQQAIELYSKAIELAPDDWRPHRYRGHRYISHRQFDKAILDLEKARELAPLNWDVAYHLGLAYFVSGKYGDAADEYCRCLDLSEDPEAQAAQNENFRSCSQNKEDPESMVAMTEWAVRAAKRDNREEKVIELLEPITADLEIEENVAYYHDLLFYKGLKTADELLNPGPDGPYRRETVGFAIANWQLANADSTAAKELLEELVADPWWPGFGRIAAEAELVKLR